MRNLFALLLALSLAAVLAACGNQTPTEVPATQAPAAAAEGPSGGGLDLAPLSQADLEPYVQDLNLTNMIDGTTVILHTVTGDTMGTLVTYTVTFPEAMNVEGTDDAIHAEFSHVPGGTAYFWGKQEQTDDTTVEGTYGMVTARPDLRTDGATTVTIDVAVPTPTQHTFQFKVPAAQVRSADLLDKDGTKMGTVAFSPFGITAEVYRDYDTLSRENPSIVLKDADGQVLRDVPAGGWSGNSPCSAVTHFRTPVDPDRVTTVSVGNLTATFEAP